MIESLIDKYKGVRKNSLLKSKVFQYKYAFVGIGQHSLSNLYPVIDYLGVPLKYIYSRTLENAKLHASKYHAIATDDLSKILNDPEVKGVFLCSHPKVHFSFSKQILTAGKHMFVEKPPCTDLEELEELTQVNKKSIVQVGLQKRYATVYSTLKKKLKSPQHYSLRFCTGAYPEGDQWMDLFIHPLDLICHLFGVVADFKIVQTANAQTYLLLLEHVNGVKGQIELSTDYSWSSPVEELKVSDQNGAYFSSGVNYLEFFPKGKSLLGIPLEKIIKQNTNKEILLDNNGFVPVSDFNSLSIQGYYQELKSFLDVVEGNSKNTLTSLDEVKPVFSLLKNIKSSL